MRVSPTWAKLCVPPGPLTDAPKDVGDGLQVEVEVGPNKVADLGILSVAAQLFQAGIRDG